MTAPIGHVHNGNPIDENWYNNLADLVNSHDTQLATSKILFAKKSTDQSVTSSTTFVDATDLSVPVAANATYEVTAVLWQFAGSTGDFKGQFVIPSGASITYTPMSFNTGATASVPDQAIYMLQLTDTTWAGGGAAGPILIKVEGILIVGSTAGTAKIQFAQNTSNGTATTLFARSFLRLDHVA